MTLYDLPAGWVWMTLGELADVRGGVTKGRDLSRHKTVELPYLRVANVQSGYLDLSLVKTIRVKADEVQRYALQPGDVLFTEGGDRDKLGRGAVWNGEIEGCTHQNHIFRARLRTRGVEPQWISFAGRLPYARAYFDSVARQTVNLASINATNLRAFPIPVPPIREQRSILARVEGLYEQSQAARDALDCIPLLLQRYRQAVLSAAFRGELTERDPDDEPASVLVERVRGERRRRWEEELWLEGKDPAKQRYEEALLPDTSELPQLPAGWVWMTLAQLADVRSGVTKGRDLAHHATTEVPYLRVANVQSGYLDLRVVKTVLVKTHEVEQYRLRHGDILFTEGGDRDKLGRGTVWQGEIETCIHQNHIFRARLYTSEIESWWISLASGLPYARAYFDSVARQTVNLASINATNLRAFPLPIAPERERQSILAKVADLLESCQAVHDAGESARARVDLVDQAILGRAFRGELVPQDPDDEPASVLLERIRGQRAQHEPRMKV